MAYYGAGALEEGIQGLKNTKINLMVLIVSMPVGGVENLILSIVRKLDKDKFNITICCIRELGSLGKRAGELGIDTLCLDLMKSSRFDPGISFKISKVLKDLNIHILWTHQYVANLYGRMASFIARTPVVIPAFHVLYDRPKLHRRMFNHLLAYRTDMMVAVSNAVAADMIRYDMLNSRKIKVIYNGVDLNKFQKKLSQQEARKIFDLPPEGMIIGSVGRLTEQKGHRYLIEAASKLENVCVAIAGDGPLTGDLKQLAGQLNINCVFSGEMAYEQVPDFLRTLDIFCFPSLWEGFGISLVEAMAAGIPVVASDIPPHREVVDEAGIFFPPADSTALLHSLKMLIDGTSLMSTYSIEAKKRAEIFSIEKTVKAYEDLFNDALRKKKVI